jgi:hypothetical protein
MKRSDRRQQLSERFSPAVIAQVLDVAAWLSEITLVSVLLASCDASQAHKVTSDYELTPISLPGASGVVRLTILLMIASTGKLWVPASNTGSVDVIDEISDAFSQVAGFKTGEVELPRTKSPVGAYRG